MSTKAGTLPSSCDDVARTWPHSRGRRIGPADPNVRDDVVRPEKEKGREAHRHVSRHARKKEREDWDWRDIRKAG